MALTHDDNGEPTAADAEEISEFSEAVVSVCRRVQRYLATYEEGRERSTLDCLLYNVERLYYMLLAYDKCSSLHILEAVSKSLSILVDLDAGMQSGYVTTVVSRSRRGRPRLDVNQAQLEYLLQLGFTCPLIGEALGVSLSTVRRQMAVWPQCDSTVF